MVLPMPARRAGLSSTESTNNVQPFIKRTKPNKSKPKPNEQQEQLPHKGVYKDFSSDFYKK